MKVLHKLKGKISLLVITLCVLGIAHLSFAQTNIKIESLSTSLFPFVYSNVSVKDNGTPVEGLIKDDFAVYENNALQLDYFDVIPPQAGGGVRLADIVFIIDCSGSMGGEITSVRNNIINFTNALATSNIDFRLGLVRFGYRSGSNPYLFNSGNLTGDAEQFKGFVSQLRASGGYEPGYHSIRQAITGFTFRPGSQKIFLIITDEDSDGALNKQQTIDMALANSVTVHAAVRCNSGASQSHYCNSTSIRAATGGLLFGVSSNYNTILDTIAEQTSSTYVLLYKSSNPNIDGTERTVEIHASANGTSDRDTTNYVPGAAPTIILTHETNTLFMSPPLDNQSLVISALIEDNVAPFLSSSRLYYRTAGSTNYQSTTMTETSGDIWEGVIPASIVQAPSIEFYITATDGQFSSSLPKFDPSSNPINIAILPNELPIIDHQAPPIAVNGMPLEIQAEISDTTNSLSSVKFFYRRVGEINFTVVGFSVGLTYFQLNTYIPGETVGPFGVEYFIQATDNFGASSYYGTSDNPISVKVIVNEIFPGDWISNLLGTNKSTTGSLWNYVQDTPQDQLNDATLSSTKVNEPITIIVHGWNPNNKPTMPSWQTNMASFIKEENNNANVFLWEWLAQAATPGPPSDNVMAQQAYHLATAIKKVIPAGYNGDIHFIGHSAGGRVSYEAVNILAKQGINISLLTLLDAYMFNASKAFQAFKNELVNPLNYNQSPITILSKALTLGTSTCFGLTPTTEAQFFENYWSSIGGLSNMWGYYASSLFKGVNGLVLDEAACFPDNFLTPGGGQTSLDHLVPQKIKDDYYATAGLADAVHKPSVNWYMASMIDHLEIDSQGNNNNEHQYGYYWAPLFNNIRPNKSDISLLYGCEQYYDLVGSTQVITDIKEVIAAGIELTIELLNLLEEKAEQAAQSIIIKSIDTLEDTQVWVCDKADSLYKGVSNGVSWLIAKTGSPVSFSKQYALPEDADMLAFTYEILEADNDDILDIFINEELVYSRVAMIDKGQGRLLSELIDTSKWLGETITLTFRINSYDGSPLIIKIYDVIFGQLSEKERIFTQDEDFDGLADILEVSLWNNLSQSPDDDDDQDGLTNEEELFQYHTDPTESDSDGDGTTDGQEVSTGRNPLEVDNIPGDLNVDGIIDRNDVNMINANRNQPASVCPDCDIDGDGTITILDARKLMTMCTHPRCASN